MQYRAIKYAERLEAEDAVASVGSKGDSYDNAMAEALNSLFKAELVRNKGPWRDINDLEVAVAEWVDWYVAPRVKLIKRSDAASNAIWLVVCSEFWLPRRSQKTCRQRLDRYRRVYRRLHGELGHVPPVEFERANALVNQSKPVSISN